MTLEGSRLSINIEMMTILKNCLNGRILVLIIIAQFFILLILGFRRSGISTYPIINEPISQIRDSENCTCSKRNEPQLIATRQTFRCQPLDYTSEDWEEYILEPDELNDYTLDNMLWKVSCRHRLQGLWSWHCAMKSNIRSSFQDCAPEIYWCPVIKWITVTWRQDRAPG